MLIVSIAGTIIGETITNPIEFKIKYKKRKENDNNNIKQKYSLVKRLLIMGIIFFPLGKVKAEKSDASSNRLPDIAIRKTLTGVIEASDTIIPSECIIIIVKN